MPRVGSFINSTPGCGRSIARPNSSFCWLPPLSLPAAAASRRGSIATRSAQAARRRARAAGQSKTPRRVCAPKLAGDEGCRARCADGTCPRRRDPRTGTATSRATQCGTEPSRKGLPSTLTRPRGVGNEAGERARHHIGAGADLPGDAENFSARRGQRHVMDAAGDVEAFDHERVARIRRRGRRRIHVAERAAEHQLDQLLTRDIAAPAWWRHARRCARP